MPEEWDACSCYPEHQAFGYYVAFFCTLHTCIKQKKYVQSERSLHSFHFKTMGIRNRMSYFSSRISTSQGPTVTFSPDLTTLFVISSLASG